MIMKKNKNFLLIIIIMMLLFVSCAHQVDLSICLEGTKEYGFWNGLWHGMISPITFIGHLFNNEIAVFATNLKGEGGWYYFGFLSGVSAFSKGGFNIVTNNKRK
jgi:hypothetical protein